MTDQELIQYVLLRALEHQKSICITAQKIQKVYDEKTSPTEQEKADLMLNKVKLMLASTVLNDVIHPLYGKGDELYPSSDISELISMLRKEYKQALKDNLFPPCKCESCNENTSRDTGKAE